MGPSTGHSDMERGQAQIPLLFRSPAVLMLGQAYPGPLPVLPVRGAGSGAAPPCSTPRPVPHPLLLLLPAAYGRRHTETTFQFRLQSWSFHKLAEKKGSPWGASQPDCNWCFLLPKKSQALVLELLQIISASKITSCFVCF